jgi:hypothetical protein
MISLRSKPTIENFQEMTSNLHRKLNNSAVSIDIEIWTHGNGKKESYFKLVIFTGSRITTFATYPDWKALLHRYFELMGE